MRGGLKIIAVLGNYENILTFYDILVIYEYQGYLF